MSDKPPPRNLADVITQMLDVIPPNETKLRETLGAVRDSARFAAPEIMPTWWQEGANALTDTLLGRTDAWVQRVADIWCGRAPEEQS